MYDVHVVIDVIDHENIKMASSHFGSSPRVSRGRCMDPKHLGWNVRVTSPPIYLCLCLGSSEFSGFIALYV